MTRPAGRLPLAVLVLLIARASVAQEPAVEIPPVDRKPYSIGGLLEVRPAIVWQDAAAALLRIRAAAGESRDAHSVQFNSRLQLDAGYRKGWLTLQSRTVVSSGYADGDWTGDATAYEAYVSVKPAPALTIDAGKKTLKWGKGYIWNPAAFIDRQKSPEDPALALEGFTALSADYIRTFGGPVQVVSLTPVLVPVYGDLNESFGRRGHLNLAGKLYVLLLDTDLDVMFLSGGSQPSRVGFDLSRNLRSNLEVHAEWARTSRAGTPVLDEAGVLVPRDTPATSVVVGVRYLTTSDTTLIVDYFRNGVGRTSPEMETFFDLVQTAVAVLDGGGDARLLAQAARAADAGYGRMHPMRNYVYARVTQPDVFDVLYLMFGAAAIVNADDGSYAVLPEIQYKPAENLELRGFANIQRGSRRTEFGEKQADVRFELRLRYYF